MKNKHLSHLYFELQTLHDALKVNFLQSVSNVVLNPDFGIQSFKYHPTHQIECDFGYGDEDTVRIEIKGKEYFGEFPDVEKAILIDFTTILARALHYTGNTYCDIAGIVGKPMLSMLIAGGHTEEVKTWRMK